MAGKDFSDDFMVEDAAPGGAQQTDAAPREGDPHRLAQRQKQVDLGKNTLGYQRYRTAVPRDRRSRKNDPSTPDVYQICSKRAFEGQVKKWRRMLHVWDPPGAQGEDGEPALLPVVADLGPLAANPPAPVSGEQSYDDYELISHADAAAPIASAASAAATAPKNGRALPAAAAAAAGGGAHAQLPLKMPSAVRKRAYDETVAAGSENQRPPQQQHPNRPQHLGVHSAQPARLQPDAKQQRRSAEGGKPTATVAGAAGAAVGQPNVQSWAEERYQQPELDWGESNDSWQHVQPEEGRPTQFPTMFYNNPAATEWNEDDIQV